MNFRPCIDIHNGAVKQIVGGSISDKNNKVSENFVSSKNADYYANLYKNDNLKGGHIIILNQVGSDYYKKSLLQAELALSVYKNGLQIGGGINDTNASYFIQKGASHVITTSFAFKNGEINFNNINKLVSEVGKKHIVLDLSCRIKDGKYFVVTDRWQKFTDAVLDQKLLDELSTYCDEFLVHAVDVEGKSSGIDEDIISILSKHQKNKIVYAGGVSSFEDINLLNSLSSGKIDITIGTALDLFGGHLEYRKIVDMLK